MKIDHINNYLSEERQEEVVKIVNEIYQITKFLNETYPGYKKWFFNKQVIECYKSSRDIIFVRNESDEIVGISCLKKENNERKICTLFVKPNYRLQGIGSMLLEESMEFLETNKPLITLTDDKLIMFEKIIKKYEWELTEIVYNENTGKKELCFNGKLTKAN